MSIDTLDIEYIRMKGEGIHARLFPAQKADGRWPVAQPVGLVYKPAEGIEEEILFVPMRAVQWIDEEIPEDVPRSRIRVVLENDSFVTDIVFEKEPNVTLSEYGNYPEVAVAVNALLRAVAGVL